MIVGCTHTSSLVQRPQNVQQQIVANNTQQQIDKQNDIQHIETGAHICIKEHCFQVEIADEGVERMNGLMRRESMDSDKGMRFVFDAPTAHLAFWMKNTLIPLDMIWVDNDMHIASLARDVPPCEKDPCPSYDPGALYARYVLEVNAGEIEKHGFATGDIVLFKE